MAQTAGSKGDDGNANGSVEMNGQSQEASKAYWKDLLANSIPAELPIDFPRSPSSQGGGTGIVPRGQQRLVFPQDVSSQILQFAGENSLPQLAFFVALFRALHYRITFGDEATIAATTCPPLPIPIRLPVDDSTPFIDLCRTVAESLTKSSSQRIQLSEISSSLESIVTRVLVALHPNEEKFSNCNYFGGDLDLAIHLFHDGRQFIGDVTCSAPFLLSSTIRNTLGAYTSLAKGALTSPTTPIQLLTFVDCMHLVNSVTSYNSADKWGHITSSIGNAFKRVVADNYALTAVKDLSGSLTYGELDHLSDRLAHYLVALGLSFEAPVGVFLELSCFYAVANLAIMKARFAYVPLDLSFPPERVKTILEDQKDPTPVVIYSKNRVPNRIKDLSLRLMEIESMLDDSSHDDVPFLPTSGQSFAYVMYTSGSTGKPEGVMIEHKSIVRLAYASDLRGHPGEVWLHVSKIAFDASTCEMWCPLLVGATTVMVNEEQVLDLPALAKLTNEENCNVSIFVPAFYNRILAEVPHLLTPFTRLMLGADSVQLADARRVMDQIRGVALGAFGPTECCCIVGIAHINNLKVHRNICPVGRPISNDIILVLDDNGNPVPPDVFGEIYVAGDSLARGYTDPVPTEKAFFEIEFPGFKSRVYRSGDWGKYRAADGNLEFGGRRDQQVKVRGFRIELTEVEHALRKQKGVGEAAAVVDPVREQLVGFVTPAAIEQELEEAEEEDNDERVEGWKNIFDQGHYADIDDIGKFELGRDFAGWKDMVTGIEHPRDFMNDWLDEGMEVIHSTGFLGNVIEIGFGTGMILFNLDSTQLQSYVGLDPSRRAVDRTTEVIARTPYAGKAVVQEGTAADFLNLSIAPDLFLCNSVAQYFPNRAYLENVVKQMIQMVDGRPARAVFGDVRSLPLFDYHSGAWAIFNLQQSDKDLTSLTSTDIKQAKTQVQNTHAEFLIDPAFWFFMQQQFPAVITHVEVKPKLMKTTNELSRYRYQAIIWFNQKELSLFEPPSGSWIDYSASPLTQEDFVQRLSQLGDGEILAVEKIPNSKLGPDRALAAALSSPKQQSWDSIISLPPLADGFEPYQLAEIAARYDLRADFSWARQRNDASVDVVFSKLPSWTKVRFPAPGLDGPLSNTPANLSKQSRLDARSLRAGVRQLLPFYFVPDTIHILEEFPFNQGGKVDRKALKAMLEHLKSTTIEEEYVAPSTEMESAIVNVFQDVLGVKPLSAAANFFESGGHSLLAVKVVGRLQAALSVPLTIRQLFDNPTAVAMAKNLTLTDQDNVKQTAILPIPRRPGGLVPPSFGQERLYFLEQLTGDRIAYVIPLILRIEGILDVQALKGAVDDVQKRHEVLRTVFVEGETGVMLRVVDEGRPLEISDLRGVTEAHWMDRLKVDVVRPFDLQAETGFRASLWVLSGHSFILNIAVHHVFSDAGSFPMIRDDIRHFYEARKHGKSVTLPDFPVQYIDFAAWQRLPDQQAEHERQLAYWVNQLKGSRAAELPAELIRPPVLEPMGGRIPIKISGHLGREIDHFSKRHGVTHFMFFLATFRALLYRITSLEDVNIATAVANRGHPELENLVGFFVNTQAMRIIVEDTLSFKDLLKATRQVATDAFLNQDVAFEAIVKELNPARDRSRNPLAQLFLGVHPEPYNLEGAFPDLEVEVLEPAPTVRFDTHIDLFRDGDGYTGHFDYSKGLFTSSTAALYAQLFEQLISEFLEHPNVPLNEASFSNASEQLSSLGLLSSNSFPYPKDQSLSEVFKQVASAHGDLIAVKDKHQTLTYEELDSLSDAAALNLAKLQLPFEAPVGVYADRSCSYITAILGIIKAGLAYIPLDPRLPAQRLNAILSDVTTPLVVCYEDGLDIGKLEGLSPKLISVNDLSSTPDPEAKQFIHPSTGDSLAYQMYTSGSTGKPKGVMVLHRGIMRLAISPSAINAKPGQRWAHLTNTGFDLSTWEIWSPLLNGATVVCIDRMTVLDFPALTTTLEAEDIQVSNMTPAVLHRCLVINPQAFKNFETLLLAGEVIDPADAKAISQIVKGSAYNAFGPTEATVYSSIYRFRRGADYPSSVPIGRSWSNSTLYLLDAKQRLVPPGVVGSIWVGGDGLARGYTDREKTLAVFKEVIVQGKKQRLYRTGDRGRWRPDGEMEFLGREDYQVKVRGNRIELGEIEFILSQHPTVAEAVTIVRTDQEGDQHLVAFVRTAEKGSSASVLELKDHVATRLPTYMVPSAIEFKQEFPLSVAGKTDRKALEAMGQSVQISLDASQVDLVAPRNKIEEVIVRTFSELVGHNQIGVLNSFFDMGGHSLLATKATSRISKQVGVSVTVAELFDFPRPADLATRISEKKQGSQTAQPATIPRAESTDGTFHPSFAQTRLWFLDQLSSDKTTYLMPFVLRITGQLNVPALEAALDDLRSRHETLRTIFPSKEGKPFQQILPFKPSPLEVIDFQQSKEAELTARVEAESKRAFRLDTEPGYRPMLFQAGTERFTLLLAMHHIISDGWSSGVIENELRDAYNARREGRVASFPALQIQYRDFAEFER